METAKAWGASESTYEPAFVSLGVETLFWRATLQALFLPIRESSWAGLSSAPIGVPMSFRMRIGYLVCDLIFTGGAEVKLGLRGRDRSAVLLPRHSALPLLRVADVVEQSVAADARALFTAKRRELRLIKQDWFFSFPRHM